MSTLTTSVSFATRTAGELIPPDSPLAAYVSVDKGTMHGEPCFKGARVPIKILFDHLRGGDGIDVFLKDFPPVTRNQAIAVIDLAAIGLVDGLRSL
ncbi:MAG TPA: DUF433 domain-containing protein [Tepidisphaeraceae bacterium]|nr:DUF433 domain-containing protein [Tepidisphaeraceae bacterium]